MHQERSQVAGTRRVPATLASLCRTGSDGRQARQGLAGRIDARLRQAGELQEIRQQLPLKAAAIATYLAGRDFDDVGIVDEAALAEARCREIGIATFDGEAVAAVTLTGDWEASQQLGRTNFDDELWPHVRACLPLRLGVVYIKALHRRPA